MEQVIQVILILFQVIGFSTILFRVVAPLTKNKADDSILKKLEYILSVVSLNKSDNGLTINIESRRKI